MSCKNGCGCSKNVILFTKTREVRSPRKAHVEDAGIDFFVPDDFEPVVLKPHESTLIPSGIKVHIPKGKALVGFNKSGVASKRRLVLGACVIDSGYEDEIFINIYNTGNEDAVIQSDGKAIAQFLLMDVPVLELVEISHADYEKGRNLSEGARGANGFGSTDNA